MSKSELVGNNSGLWKAKIVRPLDPSEEYRNDLKSIKNEPYCTYHGSGYIRYSNLDVDSHNQVRVGDIDTGHKNNLKNQILCQGLSELPYIEVVHKVNKLPILDGHHRIQALNELHHDESDNEGTSSLIPVYFVEWDKTPDGQRAKVDWLHRQNNKHLAGKTQNWADAVRYLKDRIAENYLRWDSRLSLESELKAVKEEMYAALDGVNYSFNGFIKKKVFLKACDTSLNVDTHRMIPSATLVSNCSVAWNLGDGEKDRWVDNNYHIATTADASAKNIQHAIRKRIEFMDTNNLLGDMATGNMKLFLAVNSGHGSDRSLGRKRKSQLDILSRDNRFGMGANPFVPILIKEVLFAAQFKGKNGKGSETTHLGFFWDEQRRTWLNKQGVEYTKCF